MPTTLWMADYDDDVDDDVYNYGEDDDDEFLYTEYSLNTDKLKEARIYSIQNVSVFIRQLHSNQRLSLMR